MPLNLQIIFYVINFKISESLFLFFFFSFSTYVLYHSRPLLSSVSSVKSRMIVALAYIGQFKREVNRTDDQVRQTEASSTRRNSDTGKAFDVLTGNLAGGLERWVCVYHRR